MCLLASVTRASDVKLDAAKLAPGTRIDLTGSWNYKPGYALAPGESPATADATGEGYFPVPVPQILNKIYWWLDDSEDFKKDEDARLEKFGFDTEKAEDGWYRKWIELPEAGLPKGSRLFIQFDGVAMRSDVFINGHKLGHHDGMFSRFEYDLTDHLKPGKNLLAAFVSMEKIPPTKVSLGEAVTVNLTASKILSMSKGMYGPLSPGYPNRAYDLHGIWQPVRLVVTGGAKIDDVFFRSTPDFRGAIIDVDVSSPDGKALTSATIHCRIRDPKSPQGIFELSSGVTKKTTRLEGRGPAPMKVWTPAEPNLYQLEVTLEEGGVVLDRWTHRVGFRTFEAKDGKLLLNGKPYWVRGANQLPYGKNPTDPALARKLLQLVHDANIAVVRTHCTPWNEAWLDAADEIGVGVSIEGIRPWALVGKIGPTPPDMMKHWLMENGDVIKRIRNHPSVLIWTVGNEMMLKDEDNLEKWKQLSEVTRQTRQLDPSRPIAVSSTYVREKKQYDELLAPNKIDDGDIDDPHSYKAWYNNSPFVSDSKFEAEFKRRGDVGRPYMGQEFSTGYPDLDTGLPVLRYTRDLLTPQAWVGVYAYPGNDPAWFLEYNRAATKRWAEQLRFQRAGKTAGFSLFSLECWFSHGYDASRVKPYPVVEAVRQAFAPVGVALETARRRFYSGEELETNVFVSNDDEQFCDYAGLSVQAQFVDPAGGEAVAAQDVGQTDVAYYATVKLPLKLMAPVVEQGRRKLHLVLRVLADGKEISSSTDPVEVFARPAAGEIEVKAGLEMHDLPPALKVFASTSQKPAVILVGPAAKAGTIDDVLKKVEAGATAILFSPARGEMAKRFRDDVIDDDKAFEEDYRKRVEDAKTKGQPAPKKPQDPTKKDTGEFADWTPARGTKLVEGLEPMDLRWWGRTDDWRVFVSASSHRLMPGGKARELIRYIPAHGYIPDDRVPMQYRTVLFELPVGKGRLWVCDLDLVSSLNVDPVADLVARNLVAAAADPESTQKLLPMPSHEEMLKGKLPSGVPH